MSQARRYSGPLLRALAGCVARWLARDRQESEQHCRLWREGSGASSRHSHCGSAHAAGGCPFRLWGRKTRGPLSCLNHGLGQEGLGQLPRRRSARVPGQAGHHGPGPAAEIRRHVLQRGGRLREQDAGFRCPQRGAAGREDSSERPGQRPRIGESARDRGGHPAQGPRPGREQGARARVPRPRRGRDPERHRQRGVAEPRSQGQGKGAPGHFPACLRSFLQPWPPWPGHNFLQLTLHGAGGPGGGKGHPPLSVARLPSPDPGFARVATCSIFVQARKGCPGSPAWSRVLCPCLLAALLGHPVWVGVSAREGLVISSSSL